MIGEFTYEPNASDGSVVLELGWDNDTAVARVLSPLWVIEALKGDIDVRERDEFLIFPIALCYGLLVSAKSKATLKICGDRTAWPAEWGELRTAQPEPAIRFH